MKRTHSKTIEKEDRFVFFFFLIRSSRRLLLLAARRLVSNEMASILSDW